MSSSLLMTRRFAPLFWTQFFAAFSDNFLKTSLVFLLLFHIGGADAEALITLAAAVFIAPYFFLSALGGELADRYDKAKVAQRLKFTEIGIAVIAVVGFGLHSVVLLFFALFLFGVIAALFGPIKYGILPDHLARSELPGGSEESVIACLAILSISIAIGSGLAAWLAAGRIILLPTLIGAVLLGLFAIDLGFSTLGAPPIPRLDGYVAIFTSVRGIRFALDLAGLAIAGGLFIVPTFAAVQAWAGADRRARVVAAVNVLNAAFMAEGRGIVGPSPTPGATTSPPCFFVCA